MLGVGGIDWASRSSSKGLRIADHITGFMTMALMQYAFQCEFYVTCNLIPHSWSLFWEDDQVKLKYPLASKTSLRVGKPLDLMT